MRFGRSGFAMKWRPNAIRLATPLATAVSAVSGSKPPATMIGPLKIWPNSFAATGPHAFRDQVTALDPGLDDMEIGELEVVEPLRDIAEERPRIAVCHPVEGAAGRKANTHPIGAPD